MGVRAKLAQEPHEIIDIGIKIKVTLMDRNRAGINPVGNIDIMIRQQCLNRATQQGRKMA